MDNMNIEMVFGDVEKKFKHKSKSKLYFGASFVLKPLLNYLFCKIVILILILTQSHLDEML